MSQQHRAGRYIRQLEGYSAFMPAPLPPAPPIDIDEEMLKLLSRANRALGRLDGAIFSLPDADHFVFMYVRKEAVLSSQIEGTQSSLNDLLEAEADIKSPNRPKDVHEVANYVKAMNFGLERLEQLPVSTRLIRDIHTELMDGVRGGERSPGNLRTSQNWIGPGGCTLNNATYVPPPPHEVGNVMGALEKYIHSDDDLPSLIKIGLAHAQFETIHPFLDGNGRVGRLLITLLLCEQEILAQPVLYLSYFLRKNRAEYYETLQNIRDKGLWEEWVKFFLRAVHEVAKEATQTVRKIVDLREKHRNVIIENFGRSAASGLHLLEGLYSKPFLRVNDVATSLNLSFTSANNLVQRFYNAGILKEITGQKRNRVYIYRDYVDLF